MKKFIALGAVMFLPLLVSASTDITYIINKLLGYLSIVIPALITVAVIVFIYGIIKFIASGGDEEAKKKGRATIINGLIGLFVIVAFWGIIGVVKNSFGIDNSMNDRVLPYTPPLLGQ